MRARSLMAFLGALGLLASSLGLACDDLALPARPDGGTGGGQLGDGGTSRPLPPYAPANAIKGEVKDVLTATFATWATLGPDNKVATVEWNMPMRAIAALDGVPFEQRTFFQVPPEVARDTLVTLVSFAYMPTGHLPVGIYDTPHFDFHINVQPVDDVFAVDCSDGTMPVNEHVPPGWGVIPPPDNCLLLMGIHAPFFGAPEFNGQRFTQSTMLTYYQGNKSLAGKGARFFGFEPKFTSVFVRERKTFDIQLPTLTPGSVGRPGRAPQVVHCEYLAQYDEYHVSVSQWQDVQ